jgi:tetratricopeptide (TPR) repeat protein
MSKARFAPGLLLFICIWPVVSLAQNESVLNRQSDESARTREEREQARNILLDAARQVSHSDPAKAAGFLNRAARLQFRLNSSREALASYQSALSILKPFPQSTIRVESLNGIAYVLIQLGKCDQATKYIQQALSVSEQQHLFPARPRPYRI